MQRAILKEVNVFNFIYNDNWLPIQMQSITNIAIMQIIIRKEKKLQLFEHLYVRILNKIKDVGYKKPSSSGI